MIRIFFLLFFIVSANAQSAFETGIRKMREGRYDDAEKVFVRLLKDDMSNPRLYEALGDICGYRKDWDCAVEHYEKLLRLKPRDANSSYKYGGALGMKAQTVNKFRALSMIGDIREAFEKAILLDPKHLEARWALIELNLKLPAIAGGSIKKANRYANELMGLSPVDGYLAFGRIADHEENFKSAEKNYKLAWEKYGSKTGARKLASLYKKFNKPEKAEAVLASIGK